MCLPCPWEVEIDVKFNSKNFFVFLNQFSIRNDHLYITRKPLIYSHLEIGKWIKIKRKCDKNTCNVAHGVKPKLHFQLGFSRGFSFIKLLKTVVPLNSKHPSVSYTYKTNSSASAILCKNVCHFLNVAV